MDPTQFFKCLSDETRLTSMLLLASEGELCVCELVTALDLPQSKISRHLAQLRNCGLLDDRRCGQWVFYSLSESLPDWAKSVLAEVGDAHQESLVGFRRALTDMKARPSRC